MPSGVTIPASLRISLKSSFHCACITTWASATQTNCRARVDPLIEAVKGLLEGQDIDLDAENVVPVRLRRPRLSTSGAMTRRHHHGHAQSPTRHFHPNGLRH